MMKPSIRIKLETLAERHEEIGHLLSDPDVMSDTNRFRQLSIEYAELEPIAEQFGRYRETERAIDEAEAMAQEPDPEMAALAKEELPSLKEAIETLEQSLMLLLVPKDPNDDKNIFIEVRAGTGGDEAALFSGDLMRMYQRYADQKGWKTELISESEGEHGGYKEVIVRVMGNGVYSHLKFESGAHRVQRVPVTESQGRVHTSACTVAIMPEVDDVEEVDLNPSDIRVDTYRASGAGGQHVNKTDSAIRLTHLPTGIVVECQDERSQHKNRARAMSLLKSKILSQEQARQHQEQAQTRKSLVGSGDRSERIRTYNYAQNRVTDHRINLTLYKLDEVLEGNMNGVIEPLMREYQADQLAELARTDD